MMEVLVESMGSAGLLVLILAIFGAVALFMYKGYEFHMHRKGTRIRVVPSRGSRGSRSKPRARPPERRRDYDSR